MKYYIRPDITDEHLIEHYDFKKEPWHDHYNLVNRDDNNAGLHIWWADRNVKILLGKHAEYGIAPIPDVLVELIKDNIIIQKEHDDE